MTQETSPEQAPQTRPVFEVYTEPNPLGWSSTPDDFGIQQPITPEIFEPSNLIRRIRNAPTRGVEKVEVKVGNRTVKREVTKIIPPTSRSEIITEALKLVIPRSYREIAIDMGADAQSAEAQYDENYTIPDIEEVGPEDAEDGPDVWLAQDAQYQAGLDRLAQNPKFKETLLMQSVDAFAELDYEFHAEKNQLLMNEVRRFAAHLILARE